MMGWRKNCTPLFSIIRVHRTFIMADHIHTSIAAFRDSVLTAVAKLEFQLRDSFPSRASAYTRESIGSSNEYEDASHLEIAKLTNIISQLSLRIGSLEERIDSSAQRDVTDPIVSELLNIHPVSNTRNILVSSVRSTPALAAAVAAATVPSLDLAFSAGDAADDQCTESSIEKEEDDDVQMTMRNEEEGVEEEEEAEIEEGEEEDVEMEEEVEEEEADGEESESSSPNLVPIKIDGTVYYIDDDKNVYAETEDGYEQVGTYNPVTKKIVAETAVESEEDEDDAIEVEDFVYKGKTYQRDENNNVYLDGEQVGTWNGKRIVA